MNDSPRRPQPAIHPAEQIGNVTLAARSCGRLAAAIRQWRRLLPLLIGLACGTPSALWAADNVALGKPVTISSGTKEWALTDGLFTNNSRWFADDGYPQWAEIDLGEAHLVSQVVFSQHTQRANAYTVEVWDGGAWIEVAQGANTAKNIVVDLDPVITEKVRFSITDGVYYLKVYELEVFGDALDGFVMLEENIAPSDQWPEGVTIEAGDPALSNNPVAVNSAHIISQTFTPNADMDLAAIYFKYSATADSTPEGFTLRVQQVPEGVGSANYAQGTDLLGEGVPVSFGLASTSGSLRLMRIELGGSYQIPLLSGTTYAIELSTNDSALNLYRRGANVYPNGDAYDNRAAINFPNTRDLAVALIDTSSPPTDMDADGMDDAWEIANGLDPSDHTDAWEDADGDGVINLDEFLAGTDPNVPDPPVGGTNTVTITTTALEAYELEGLAATMRIDRTGGTEALNVNFTRLGAAGTADYVVKDQLGNLLAGAVSIPANTDSVTLFLEPTVDALAEYPEEATVALEAGSGYTVGTSSSASASIRDATDIPANEELFVASLIPPTGVNSTASGVGVLYLNGPKTRARVSLSFNGLSSAQTNSYIRWGESGSELRPNLGTGELTDVVWDIIPEGSISGQDIITGLYQGNGDFVYTNVGTTNYPAGEIEGTWTWQTAGGQYPPGPAPAITPLTGEDLRRDVARFLTQTTFGPSKSEIDALVNEINTTHGGDRMAAFEAWIDAQLALDQTNVEDYIRAMEFRKWTLLGLDVTAPTESSYPPSNATSFAWWLPAVRGHDQLRQRFGLAASEIFVVSRISSNFRIHTQRFAAFNYYDMLGSYADGNFRNLLEDVSKHPIMAEYLSSMMNQKAVLDANGNQIVSPDENYAREVMQLFSIGLVRLRLDGAVEMSGGLPIPTYDNQDIQQLARVFTGWSFGTVPGPAPDYAPVENDNFFFPAHKTESKFTGYSYSYPMRNFAEYHDTDAKYVLGNTIPAGLDGEAEMDLVMDMLTNHPSTPAFISRAFIQFFVSSNPSPGYVYRVASAFQDNGSGVRGDMKAMLKAILLDYEARSLDVADGNAFGKQREPIIRYAHLLRAFNAGSQLPISDLTTYGYPAAQVDNFPAGATQLPLTGMEKGLTMSAMRSPSVFNWFRPDYAPRGPIAEAGLVAPEMQITTETSVVTVINFFRNLVRLNSIGGANLHDVSNNDARISLDRTEMFAVYDDAIAAGQTKAEATETTLDYLDDFLMAGRLKADYASAPTPNPRSIMIDAIVDMNFNDTNNPTRELLYLFVNSPEYIHQR
ncbi:MAG: DUF1800 family protein [Verrucomicrobiota bacterium]